MTLSLNYGKISNASKNAKKIGNEIGQYIDNLNKKVQNKIDSVTGGSSTVLSNASYFINAKISQLDKRRDNAYTLSDRIANLKETAESVDKNVARTISANRKSLYKQYSCLKPNALKRAWNSLLCCLKNVPIIGNIIKFIEDMGDALSELKNKIRDWWKYEGGKIIGDIFLKIGLAVAAVCTAIAAILSGGVILIVAACVAAVIAVANVVTNTCEELNAWRALKKEKYGKSAVHSGRDSTAQWLRESNFHDSKLNKWSNIGANVIDIADSVSGAIILVYDIGKIANSFLKNHGVSFVFKERVIGKDGKWTTKVTGKSFRRGVKAMITNKALTNSTKEGVRITLFKSVKDNFRLNKTLFKIAAKNPKGYFSKKGIKIKKIKTTAELITDFGKSIKKISSLPNDVFNTISSSNPVGKTGEKIVQGTVKKHIFSGSASKVIQKTGIGKIVASIDASGNIGKYTGWSSDGIVQKVTYAISCGNGIYSMMRQPSLSYAYLID